MMPMTSRMDMCLTLWENSSTMDVMSKAPAKAAEKAVAVEADDFSDED